MIYNNFLQREEIYQLNPALFDNAPSKVLAFINLCIYPYKFELVYDAVRTQERISKTNYECLKGAITGLLVMSKRQHGESIASVDAYIVDFIRFIKGDKKGDPVKFLLSMRAYFHRFLFATGLYVAFGIDWRELVADVLELNKKPQATNYHSLLTNVYLRNLLSAYVIWKTYRDPSDEGYRQNENDVLTLLTERSKLKTSLGKEKLQALFEALQSNLPSWSYDVRRKAAHAIDSSKDGYEIIYRQPTDWRYKQMGG